MTAIAFNVLCAVGVALFFAVLWALIKEARGDYEDEDEHEEGGIG